MNIDDQIIHITEDDMGEGFYNPIDDEHKLTRGEKKALQSLWREQTRKRFEIRRIGK